MALCAMRIGNSTSTRKWKPIRDPARLHHSMARGNTLGAGFSGRTGPRHQPGARRDLSNQELHDALAFRGGTALYKLHLKPAARYSDDIDLVQTKAEAASAGGDAI